MTQPAFITMQGLYKSFDSNHVLQGFDLEIEKGESVVIIGGSGSGKSVILKHLLGLLTPDSGKLVIDGEDMIAASHAKREQVNRRIGMLFQNAALFDSLTIWQNVAFGLISGFGYEKEKAKTIALEKLHQVGLNEQVAERFPDELSGGMRKRVGLARAIACDPEILLFDEPTTGLDPIMGHVIDDLIVQSVKQLGATALSITHDMASAKRIADRMVMLYQGKAIWSGKTTDIETCGNPYVSQFIHGTADGPITHHLKDEDLD